MQERMGSGIPYTVPRGVYRCSDDKYIGISASSDSVAGRVVKLLGFEGDERFATFNSRVENRVALDEAMRAWCSQRTQVQTLQEMSDADAAAGPIMSMEDIANDPHYAHRDAIVELDGTPMQGLIAKLSETPGVLNWRGKERNADGDDIRANGWGS
jgi:crotonobetainyl-CoA:carnitine CoA-transferase CaiB-like acyl-CoA transferase